LAQEIKAIREGAAPDDGLHLMAKLTPFGQRNLLGQWVALEGAIFELDKASQVITTSEGLGEVVRWYVAADFGFHHPRLLIASYHDCGSLIVQGYWSDKGVDQTPLLDQIAKWSELVDIAGVFLPPDQPGFIQQARKRFGAGKILKANNKVLAGIGSCQVAINRSILKFAGARLPESPIPFDQRHYDLFWGEMEGYIWKRGKDGEWLDEPLKENDHFPDSLRYIVHSMVHLKRLDIHPKKDRGLREPDCQQGAVCDVP
jgi:hypothetical protein